VSVEEGVFVVPPGVDEVRTVRAAGEHALESDFLRYVNPHDHIEEAAYLPGG
jgi:hypothetical protein